MAAKRAKSILAKDATKSLRAANRQAVSEVSQVVGLDIARTKSKGLSQLDSANGVEAQYAVMNAAVAELLFDEAGAGLTSKLEGFTDALNDGAVGNGSDSFGLATLSRAIRTVVSATSNLDSAATEALNNQTAQYDAVGEDGFATDYDDDLAVDDNATQEQKIAAFQQFVAQVRTWVSSVEELDDDALVKAIDLDVETVQAIFDVDTQSQFQFLGSVLDQVNTFIINNVGTVQQRLVESGQESITIRNLEGLSVGTVRLGFSDDNGLQVSMVGEVTGEGNTTFLPFQLKLDTNLPPEALKVSVASPDAQAVTIKVARLLASNRMTLTGFIGDGQGGHTVTLDNLAVTLGLNSPIDSTAITTEELNGAFRSASLAGSVELKNHGATFAGDIEVALVRLSDDGGRYEGLGSGPVSLDEFRLSANFVDASGTHSFTASASLDVRNATTFDTFTWAEYSREEGYISGVIRADRLLALADPEPEGVVVSTFSVDKSFLPLGDVDSTFVVQDYFADGWVRPYHYSYDSQEALIANLERIRLAVISAFPDVLDVITHNAQGDPESATIAVSELLTGGYVTRVAGSGGEAMEIGFLNTTTDLVVDGGSAEIGSDTLHVTDGSIVDNGDGTELVFIRVLDATTASAVAAVLADDFVRDAEITDYVFGGPDSSGIGGGYANFSRPSKLEYYEDCLGNPEEQLQKLGMWADSYVSSNWSCAMNTLTASYTREEIPFVDDGVVLEEIARDVIAAKLGGDDILAQAL